MRALVVRHHPEDDPGLVGAALSELGYSIDLHLYPQGGRLPGADGYDHVVILGSSWSVYSELAWIVDELAWLRVVGVPVLGICFGAQLLSAAFGGTVERAPAFELGWVTVEPVQGEGRDQRASLSPGPWFEYHGDRCVLPPSARVLATNQVCVQAFTLGHHIGVQFHPEIDRTQLERWMGSGAREDVARAGIDPDALLAQTENEEPAARARATALVASFLAHGAGERDPSGMR